MSIRSDVNHINHLNFNRYDSCLIPARKKGIKRGILTSIGAALIWFCIYAGYALAFWYGVKLIVEGKDQENPEYKPGTLIIVRICLNLFCISFIQRYFG